MWFLLHTCCLRSSLTINTHHKLNVIKLKSVLLAVCSVDNRRPFSRSSAEGGGFVWVHLKSEFHTLTYEPDSVTSQLMTTVVQDTTYKSVMWKLG